MPPDVAGKVAAVDAEPVLAGAAAGDAFDELQPAASPRPRAARVASTLFRARTEILQFV